MSDETEEHRGIQGVQGIQGIAGPQGVPGVDAADVMERAGSLTAAYKENTGVLRKVMRRQRWQRLAIVLLFGLVGVSAYLWNEVDDAQRSACESGNNVRQGLLHMADVFEGSLSEPRADGRPRTEREVEQIEDFVAGLREDFALRDCS